MPRIGLARIDITPTRSVWLTGYGNRDHRSEGVYQPLTAGAVFLQGEDDQALILTADHIGYGAAYAAAAKADIAEATGLMPRQIVLTATHTHCAPFFTPWIMPGQPEPEYAAFLQQQLVSVALQAQANAVVGRVVWSRGQSVFGVNRRRPDDQGGVVFAPNPDGPMDRDLDTLWFWGEGEQLLGSLTVFGCHPTSLGGYLIGGDYPGYLCRALEEQTGAPALFSTGCAGNIRPWYRTPEDSAADTFPRPSFEQLAQAGADMAAEVLATGADGRDVDAGPLQIAATVHLLPYAERPDSAQIAAAAEEEDPRRRDWGRLMQRLTAAGPLPAACPHEIQLLRLGPDLNLVFLGGEVLTEIGLHIKAALQPTATIAVAYSNGLIGYIPGEETYDLGGYEVDGSYFYFLRPAPFAKDAERLIVDKTQELARSI